MIASTTTDAHAPRTHRFVVIHKYLGVSVWYVEASDVDAAIERVYPADPMEDGRLMDEGGQEAPYLDAHVETVGLQARVIRRFPPGVDVAFGATQSRIVGPLGEPVSRPREGRQ